MSDPIYILDVTDLRESKKKGRTSTTGLKIVKTTGYELKYYREVNLIKTGMNQIKQFVRI